MIQRLRLQQYRSVRDLTLELGPVNVMTGPNGCGKSNLYRPDLLAFNEPETSLHPQLLEPLADLIATASEASQLWITTHSGTLADAIETRCGGAKTELELREAQTRHAESA